MTNVGFACACGVLRVLGPVHTGVAASVAVSPHGVNGLHAAAGVALFVWLVGEAAQWAMDADAARQSRAPDFVDALAAFYAAPLAVAWLGYLVSRGAPSGNVIAHHTFELAGEVLSGTWWGFYAAAVAFGCVRAGRQERDEKAGEPNRYNRRV